MNITWGEFKRMVNTEIKKSGYDDNINIEFIDVTPYSDSGINIEMDEYGLEIITYLKVKGEK